MDAMKQGPTHGHDDHIHPSCNWFTYWVQVQLVDRDLMLLDLGLAGSSSGSSGADGAGGQQQPMSAGWQQTLYIALYNWQTTRMVCVLRSTSDAALALLHRYAPVMAADVTGAGDWERFASSMPSATAARELLAEALGPHARLSTSSVLAAQPAQHAGSVDAQLATLSAVRSSALRPGREGRERRDPQLAVRKALSLLAGGSQVCPWSLVAPAAWACSGCQVIVATSHSGSTQLMAVHHACASCLMKLQLIHTCGGFTAPVRVLLQLLTASPFLDSHLFVLPEKLVPVASRARACPDTPVQVFVRQVQQRQQGRHEHKMYETCTVPMSTRQPAFILDPGSQEVQPGRPAARRTMLLLAHPTQPFMLMVLSPSLGAAQSVLRVVYRSP